MGVSRSPAQLAMKLRTAAVGLQKAENKGLQKAALFTKSVIHREIEQVAPGRRMRGVGRRGARVGAAYNVRGSSATVFARGPLHLLERPTKPHVIEPKRRGKKKAVITPYGPRARVNHPGSPGKYPWRKGVAKARPLIPKVMAKEWFEPLERIFR